MPTGIYSGGRLIGVEDPTSKGGQSRLPTPTERIVNQPVANPSRVIETIPSSQDRRILSGGRTSSPSSSNQSTNNQISSAVPSSVNTEMSGNIVQPSTSPIPLPYSQAAPIFDPNQAKSIQNIPEPKSYKLSDVDFYGSFVDTKARNYSKISPSTYVDYKLNRGINKVSDFIEPNIKEGPVKNLLFEKRYNVSPTNEAKMFALYSIPTTGSILARGLAKGEIVPVTQTKFVAKTAQQGELTMVDLLSTTKFGDKSVSGVSKQVFKTNDKVFAGVSKDYIISNTPKGTKVTELQSVGVGKAFSKTNVVDGTVGVSLEDTTGVVGRSVSRETNAYVSNPRINMVKGNFEMNVPVKVNPKPFKVDTFGIVRKSQSQDNVYNFVGVTNPNIKYPSVGSDVVSIKNLEPNIKGKIITSKSDIGNGFSFSGTQNLFNKGSQLGDVAKTKIVTKAGELSAKASEQFGKGLAVSKESFVANKGAGGFIARISAPIINKVFSKGVTAQSTMPKPTQSQYYGTGQYELTNGGMSIPSSTRQLLGLDKQNKYTYTPQVTPTQVKTTSFIGTPQTTGITQTTINKLGGGSGSSSRQPQGQPPRVDQPFPQTQREESPLKINTPIPNPPNIYPNVPKTPPIPYIPKLKFSFDDGINSNKNFGAYRKSKYFPSYDAIISNIKGKAVKNPVTLALGTRPITKGFSLPFSSTGRFKFV